MNAPVAQMRAVSMWRADRSGRTVRVLDDISLAIAPGECVVVMGRSGAGKSTLASALSRVMQIDRGAVEWHDQRVSRSPVLRAVSMVPQRAELAFSQRTVRDEIALALTLARIDISEIDARVHAAAEAVGMPAELLHRDPRQLSGGELRRAAIAAALAVEPSLLVLDEPSAGLDVAAREWLESTIRELVRSGTAVLVVTHDANEAMQIATRVVVMDAGRIVLDDAPQRVLCDPGVAARCGVPIPTIVSVAAAISHRVGEPMPTTCARAEWMSWIAARIVSARSAGGPAVAASTGQPAAASSASALGAPPRVLDPRVRLLAGGVMVTAVFVASSLVGVALIGIGVVAAALRSQAVSRSLLLILRPVALLLVSLVVLQVLLGADPTVRFVADIDVHSGLLWSLRRAVQVVALLGVSMLVTAEAAPLELASGIRWLLAPLRLVRVPVEALSFIVGIGLASVGSMASELAALERSQLARGIEISALPWHRRVWVRSLLVAPLLVLAQGRARQLAEALAVRGYVRGHSLDRSWRHSGLSGRDIGVACASLGSLVAALVI